MTIRPSIHKALVLRGIHKITFNCNPTIDNMKYAVSVFGYKLATTSISFLLETEWDGEIELNF